MASCRLPVWLFDWSATGNRGTGHFLQDGNLLPATPPATSPDGIETYLAAAAKWLPVPAPLVAPDGQHYAYNESLGNPEIDRVHVVEVASGADRVVAQGTSDTGFEAIAFETDGIYAGRPTQGPATNPGLWRLDPQTGKAGLIEASHRWSWISHGFAYTVIPNPSDPVVVQGGPQADTLLRLDLGSHAVSQVLRKRGVPVRVRGFDSSGHPIVLLGSTAADLYVLTDTNAAQPLGGSREHTFAFVQPSLVAAPDGFWMGADQGILRYSTGSGFQLAWTNPKVKTVLPLVAGACA
jgi:hypothetical protein